MSSKRIAECTMLSRIASAAVVFVSRQSYQSEIGICEAMTVALRPCRSSIISIRSSICSLLNFLIPKSSIIRRSYEAIFSKSFFS